MSKGVTFQKMNGANLKIGIAVSRWNGEITESLLAKCRLALRDCGVKEKNIYVIEVPGAYELPFAASHLIKTKKPDAIVCFGSLIKGETMHFEYIAEAVTQGIMNLNLATGVPVIFGVLTTLTEAQAKARSGDNRENHGYAWGQTAVEMGLLKKKRNSK